MLSSIPLRTESPRYAASLLLLPDLWAPAGMWLPIGGFLGHRGWNGSLVELRGSGGLGERAAALAKHIAALEHPPVLVGHGAGAIVALEVARTSAAAAVVLVAPVVPGSVPCRRLTARWDAIKAIALGRDVPPPLGSHARRVYGAAPSDLAADSSRAVLDVVRGRWAPHRLAVPTLLIAGSRDPLLPREAGVEVASALGAERREIADAGHWPMLAPDWRSTAGIVHRWLVRQLGEPLLDYYAEAMADREDAE